MIVWDDTLHALIVEGYLMQMIMKTEMQEMDFVQNVHQIIREA